MQAYHDNPKLKQDFLAELRRHQAADAFVQGTYGETDDTGTFRGCAVGCSIQSLNTIQHRQIQRDDHGSYAVTIGIPEPLAYLEDRIFEGLPVKQAKQWPLRFAGAITPGADLSLVIPRFMAWLMEDLEQYATDDVKPVLRQVGSLYQHVIDGGTVSDNEWERAAQAAAQAAQAAQAAHEKMADKLIELLRAA